MDFLVDYALFLAISNRKSGDQDMWWFDKSGIRSTLSPVGNTAHDEIVRLRLIDESKADFPAMATDLRRVEGAIGERITPDWFREVVASTSAELALIALASAKVEAKRNYDEKLRVKVAAATGNFESRGLRAQAIALAIQEADEAQDALHGIELVERLLESREQTDDCSAQSNRGRGPNLSGLGAPGRLLAYAMSELGLTFDDQIDPGRIVGWLRDVADKPKGKELGLTLVGGAVMYYDATNGTTQLTPRKIRDAIKNAKKRAERVNKGESGEKR